MTPSKKVTVKISAPRRWDGPSLYAECKAQGIVPTFASGKFDGYILKVTGAKITATKLPPTIPMPLYDAYLEAEKAATATPPKGKKVKTPKAPKTPKPKAEGKRGRLDVTKRIKILAKESPKRKGSAAEKAWNCYKEDMLVSDYLAKANGSRNNLLWDIAKGYVKLV